MCSACLSPFFGIKKVNWLIKSCVVKKKQRSLNEIKVYLYLFTAIYNTCLIQARLFLI
jgi:hypothetical protein